MFVHLLSFQTWPCGQEEAWGIVARASNAGSKGKGEKAPQKGLPFFFEGLSQSDYCVLPVRGTTEGAGATGAEEVARGGRESKRGG
jgi:hypothetical protein